MILEVAILDVRTGQEAAFELAFNKEFIDIHCVKCQNIS